MAKLEFIEEELVYHIQASADYVHHKVEKLCGWQMTSEMGQNVHS